MGLKKQEVDKSFKRVAGWAGTKAYDIALDAEAKRLNGEPVNLTKEEIKTTIAASIKRFLDGDISDPYVKQLLRTGNLDLEHLRTSLVEQTLANAIPDIVANGQIERLIKLGEAAEPDSMATTPKAIVTRERVIIELNGDDVHELHQIDHRQDS